MAFLINNGAIRSHSALGGVIGKITKSDTEGCIIGGSYPRGFIVMTGGTLTVWTRDPDNSGSTRKVDFGEVSDGFMWTGGAIHGIAETDEAGITTTCDNIISIP